MTPQNYTSEGEIKPLITCGIPMDEIEIASKRSCHIRFDCLVKMFDFGQRHTNEAAFLGIESKPLPPQWFKSELRITLDGIACADPYTIGMQIKRQFEELQLAIQKYESK